jgi:serine/threonine protein kinase
VEPSPDRNLGPGADIGTRELLDMGCGRQIGRYTLLRRIAAGGMAEVYTASSKSLMAGIEKRVAIKKILPQHSHNERFIDMLVDEAKITVSLTHPNIAQVFELGIDGEDYFIVMEYVDGRPLNRLMQRVDERGINVIPVDFAAHIMAEIAKGLEHAHNQKDQRGRALAIVHRDVSPQNVLISWQGDVKLIDFGIARAEGRVNQTSHGVIKGKLRYLAPEIAAGDEPDHRADIFCCGIVLFEMLTGEAMFAPKNDLEAIELATAARVKSPRSRNLQVPQDLDDIVMKALRRDREERYQSAKDLYRDLRRFLNQHDPSFVGSELGDFMQQMFTQEITADQKLDAYAERVAAKRADMDEDEDDEPEDPTLSAGPGTLAGGTSKYKQLVTRLNVGAEKEEKFRLVGADGGHPMSVVVADPSDRPLIRSDDEPRRGTMPPMTERMQSLASPGEATVKADNPFVPGGASALPTEMAPVPVPVTVEPRIGSTISSIPDSLGPDLSETRDDTQDDSNNKNGEARPGIQLRTTSIHSGEVALPGVLPVDPTYKNHLERNTVFGRGSNTIYTVAFVAIVLAMGGTAWLISPSPRVVITPDPDPTIQLDPIAIDQEKALSAPREPASIRIEVRPEGVPVTITVDGLTKASQERTPLELGPFAAERVHSIVVSADGYVTRELKRSLGSGSNAMVVDLEPALGKIRLKGLNQGEVQTSLGRVKRDRIVDIPLDSTVDISIDWPGAKPFTTTVEVKTLDEVLVNVPAPKQLAKGTLIINSRPMSEVYIDRKYVGKTPRKLKLPPGSHRVMLKSPDGKSMSFTRKIYPGKKTTFTYQWR